ncbi:MAG TPA: hypothetical protein VGI23_10240, partial [Steroidobacteraceae bacterium]
ERLMETAMETAHALVQKPAEALQASKRLLKQWSRAQTESAVKVETEEFSVRVRSAETRAAITAFLQKRH